MTNRELKTRVSNIYSGIKEMSAHWAEVTRS